LASESNLITLARTNNSGINQLVDISQAFAVYPNPTNTFINITAKNGFTNTQLTITDLAGRKILAKEVELNSMPYQLNVAEIKEGIYFIHITTEKGNAKFKIIIQ